MTAEFLAMRAEFVEKRAASRRTAIEG